MFKAVILSMLLSTNLYAWGAPELAKPELREKKYSIEHQLDKKKAYQKILVWSAKTFANSNESIKLKDADMAMLIAKGNLKCEALKLGSGFGDNQMIDFTLEITNENKKTEVKVSELVGKSSGAYDDGARPSTKEEAELALAQCVDPFIELIKKELK